MSLLVRVVNSYAAKDVYLFIYKLVFICIIALLCIHIYVNICVCTHTYIFIHTQRHVLALFKI